MSTMVLILVVASLVAVALLMGTALDTERQRSAAREVADQRRRLHEEQRTWREHRDRERATPTAR